MDIVTYALLKKYVSSGYVTNEALANAIADFVTEDDMNTAIADAIEDLEDILKDGTSSTAEYHLGFYLDENDNLCQLDS